MTRTKRLIGNMPAVKARAGRAGKARSPWRFGNLFSPNVARIRGEWVAAGTRRK